MDNIETLKAIYNPEGSTLRKAQLRMLEILGHVDRVCRENNITWWMDYGTLLGAVRHGGFIPWDDDTDICMPIEDYKRFVALQITPPIQKTANLHLNVTKQTRISTNPGFPCATRRVPTCILMLRQKEQTRS